MPRESEELYPRTLFRDGYEFPNELLSPALEAAESSGRLASQESIGVSLPVGLSDSPLLLGRQGALSPQVLDGLGNPNAQEALANGDPALRLSELYAARSRGQQPGTLTQ